MSKVTKEQLLAWMGSDVTKDELVALLLELANDEYDQIQMRLDIFMYDNEQGESK